jgi:hydrogenase maturation factor HypF (carbamoyltransferase family)
MSKYKSCEQCDAEFKIVQTEENEEIYGKPLYCPFCSIELSFSKKGNNLYEENEEDGEIEE